VFPALERDERIDLVHQLEQGAQANLDFIMMMVLSTSLASLGLLADSTAVVIGAMLVAPLMGPLVAAGHSLIQGNSSLFRRSIIVTFIGIGIGFAASLIFGVLNPGFEPTLEIEARGKADLLDLAIAFISGMTAAYATGRSNVMTTIAGVAIAAALVPPLAVVGLALTHGRPIISYNAAILLTTNLVAIILGAATVFRMFIQRARFPTRCWHADLGAKGHNAFVFGTSPINCTSYRSYDRRKANRPGSASRISAGTTSTTGREEIHQLLARCGTHNPGSKQRGA